MRIDLCWFSPEPNGDNVFEPQTPQPSNLANKPGVLVDVGMGEDYDVDFRDLSNVNSCLR